MNPSVAIIVPALNSEETIGPCLQALLCLDPQIPHEILVVDNGSSDKTQSIALSLGVKVLNCTQKGRSQARNFGVRATHSPFIAFVDSDVMVPADWLQNALPLFSTPCIGGVQGPILPGPGKRFLDQFRLWYKKSFFHPSLIEMESARVPHPLMDTAACIVRRSAFESIRGFDEGLKSNEDRDLTWRLVAKGYSLRTMVDSPSMKWDTRSELGYLFKTFSNAKSFYLSDVRYSQLDSWEFARKMVVTRLKGIEFNAFLPYLLANVIAYNLGILMGVILYRGSTRQKFQWDLAKLNKLLPVLTLSDACYEISLSKRFSLNTQSLVFYGFKHGNSMRYTDPGLIQLFVRILGETQKIKVSSTEEKLLRPLVAHEILMKVHDHA